MKLGGKSSYKPAGTSYTAQGPQKHPEIVKTTAFYFSDTNTNLGFLDLDFGYQTFGAGSREEISCIIRICGPHFLPLSSSVGS